MFTKERLENILKIEKGCCGNASTQINAYLRLVFCGGAGFLKKK